MPDHNDRRAASLNPSTLPTAQHLPARPDEDDRDDLVFEWGDQTTEEPPVTALMLGDRRGILGALHERCSRGPAGSASALLVSVDGLAPLGRERGQTIATRVRDEAYTRVAARVRNATAAGLIDEEMLLVLFEDRPAQEAADSFEALRDDAGRIQLGESRFAVGFSAAVTEIREDDLPEAIVGRLCRALQRVMMGGGAAIEHAP
ncbi:MAG: hypothetical protein R3E83_15855 [Burkholderiaceae bacterium]